eukprot:TRINITY_DN2947_c0_g1_i1.p1 TRINITY_DN2947_c0_g1~~TRINITY_DN2947_c0_g1_i1.p1  ORF type:complete len:345 (+),score=68.15 TRINITY_DN2947_c0_g1_i1:58-1092(+)
MTNAASVHAPSSGTDELPAESVALAHALAGSAAGVFSTACTYPLDIVRTRLQLRAAPGKSPFTEVAHIIRTEGVSAIFRGMSISLVTNALSSYLYYYFYEYGRTHHKRSTGKDATVLQSLWIGAVAGALTQCFVTPLVVTHTRFVAHEAAVTKEKQAMKQQQNQHNQQNQHQHQHQHQLKSKSYSQICSDLLDEKGLLGFWSGLGTSLILVVNPSITYMVFEQLKTRLLTVTKTKHLTTHQNFLLGAMSKIVATIATYPLILAKTRLQTRKSDSDGLSSEPYKGFLDVVTRILRAQGFFGLYAGMQTQLVKATINAALVFSTQQKFVQYSLAFMIWRHRKSMAK